MIDQMVNLATRIFLYTFFNCQTVFVFDNNTNHAYYVKNTLLIKIINLNIDGKQS